jgi:hypothetical protein
MNQLTNRMIDAMKKLSSWKSPVTHLIKNFLIFNRTQSSNKTFTSVHHWLYILSKVNPVHTAPIYFTMIHFNAHSEIKVSVNACVSYTHPVDDCDIIISAECSPTWKANSCSVCEAIPNTLWNQKFH